MCGGSTPAGGEIGCPAARSARAGGASHRSKRLPGAPSSTVAEDSRSETRWGSGVSQAQRVPGFQSDCRKCNNFTELQTCGMGTGLHSATGQGVGGLPKGVARSGAMR